MKKYGDLPLQDKPWEPLKPGEVSYRELKRERFYMSMNVDEMLKYDVEWKEVQDIAKQEIVYTLYKTLYTDNLEDFQLKVETPKTWWDHFKKDVLPYWVKKHLKPVQYKIVSQKYQVKAIYNIVSSDKVNNLRIVTYNPDKMY